MSYFCYSAVVFNEDGYAREEICPERGVFVQPGLSEQSPGAPFVSREFASSIEYYYIGFCYKQHAQETREYQVPKARTLASTVIFHLKATAERRLSDSANTLLLE